jgi:hypothetical protein
MAKPVELYTRAGRPYSEDLESRGEVPEFDVQRDREACECTLELTGGNRAGLVIVESGKQVGRLGRGCFV